MKNKRIILLLSFLLIVSLVLSGCPFFRRPVPERQPVPQPTPTPPQQQPQQLDPNQRPVDPSPGPQTQPRSQPAPDAMDLANRVADIATDVQGVDNAVVVVISNLALVGITMESTDAANRGEAEIKREVASRIEDREPAVVNAYVSANPDIVRQLQEISRGIQRGEPITTFFDQITEVLRRMRAETDNN